MVLEEVRKQSIETHSNFDEVVDKIPTREEISSAVSSLNKDKECGLDSIVAEHLLFADTQSSVQLLETVFKRVYEAEEYPCHFKKGLAIPIFK
jgi:Tfp pilus assembly protein PilO